MRKGFKRHIKQDELVTGVGRALAFVNSHAREAKVTAAVVLAVAAGVFAWVWVQGRRSRGAEAALASALEVFHSPAADELPAGVDRPPGPAASTATEKYQKAVGQLEGVAQSYGHLRAGRRARYYAAVSRLELGQFAEAEKLLSEISSQRAEGDLEAHLARLELAEVYRKGGQTDKALTAYRQMAEDTSLSLPRDHVLMRLSTLLEEARRLPDARAGYERLVQEFPGSVYAAEARRRADYLRLS